MDLKEMRWDIWIEFIWLKIGTGGEHNNEPSGSIEAENFLISWATINFSRTTVLDDIS
jgi:hypothetical protein